MTLLHAETAGYVVGYWGWDEFHVEAWFPTVQEAQEECEHITPPVVVYALLPLSAFGGTPGADHA